MDVSQQNSPGKETHSLNLKKAVTSSRKIPVKRDRHQNDSVVQTLTKLESHPKSPSMSSKLNGICLKQDSCDHQICRMLSQKLEQSVKKIKSCHLASGGKQRHMSTILERPKSLGKADSKFQSQVFRGQEVFGQKLSLGSGNDKKEFNYNFLSMLDEVKAPSGE